MSVIYIYNGNHIPDYAEYSLIQLRKFSPYIDIYFVGSRQYLQERNNWWSKYAVKPICSEEFDQCEMIRTYEEVSWLKAWEVNTLHPSPRDFVHQTSKRVFLLNEVLHELQLKNSVHIECDILYYQSVEQTIEVCKKLFNKLTITDVGKSYVCFGLCYIPNRYAMQPFCDFYLELLKLGDAKAKQRYPSMTMIQEMEVGAVAKHMFEFLPCLPTDQHYGDFRVLHDCASWGQRLGGTNSAHHGVGYAASHHWIGRKILAGEIDVEFKNGKPWVYTKWDNQRIPLANLHVHSKQLEKFLS